ncbi:MAG: hypothetical protein KDB23_32380 [Planctomycetales bacterium]|nr:hypothetical protein [Planctomycetales bacterium]
MAKQAVSKRQSSKSGSRFDDEFDDDELYDDRELFDDDGELIEAAPQPDEFDEFEGISLFTILGQVETGWDPVYQVPTYSDAPDGWLLQRGDEYAGTTLNWSRMMAYLPAFATRDKAVVARREILQKEAADAAESEAIRTRPCVLPVAFELRLNINTQEVPAAKVELSAAAMSAAAALADVADCTPAEAIELLLTEVIGEEIKRLKR